MSSFIIIKCHPNLAAWIKKQTKNLEKEINIGVKPRDFEAQLGKTLPDIDFEVLIGKQKGRGKIKVKSIFEL